QRVDVLLPLVVTLADVPLAVLVGEHRGGCLEDGLRDVVLRRDQPDLVLLPALLRAAKLVDFGIRRLQQVNHRRQPIPAPQGSQLDTAAPQNPECLTLYGESAFTDGDGACALVWPVTTHLKTDSMRKLRGAIVGYGFIMEKGHVAGYHGVDDV